jgi:hypothetical protein
MSGMAKGGRSLRWVSTEQAAVHVLNYLLYNVINDINLFHYDRICLLCFH